MAYTTTFSSNNLEEWPTPPLSSSRTTHVGPASADGSEIASDLDQPLSPTLAQSALPKGQDTPATPNGTTLNADGPSSSRQSDAAFKEQYEALKSEHEAVKAELEALKAAHAALEFEHTAVIVEKRILTIQHDRLKAEHNRVVRESNDKMSASEVAAAAQIFGFSYTRS